MTIGSEAQGEMEFLRNVPPQNLLDTLVLYILDRNSKIKGVPVNDLERQLLRYVDSLDGISRSLRDYLSTYMFEDFLGNLHMKGLVYFDRSKRTCRPTLEGRRRFSYMPAPILERVLNNQA